MLHVDGLGTIALVVEVLDGLFSPGRVDLEAGVASPTASRSCRHGVVLVHLSRTSSRLQLGVALLGEVLEVNGAVVHGWCELLVSGQVVLSRQVVALNDPFITYFSKLDVALFNGPARGQSHAFVDHVHIADKLHSLFGIISKWSIGVGCLTVGVTSCRAIALRLLEEQGLLPLEAVSLCSKTLSSWSLV